MTTFLFASAALLLAALGILTWPLLRRSGGAARGLRREVDLAARQLRQLEELQTSGALTGEQFAASRAALERRVIDALALTGGDSANPPRPIGLTLSLAAFVLITTAAGYRFVGSPGRLAVGPGEPSAIAAQASSDASAPAPHDLSQAQVEQLVDQLAARLQSRPDDAPGWAMLARSRVALGQHDKAVEAFAQAARLLPDNPDLLADYADALAMAHGRRLDGEPLALLQRALAVDPHHPKSLALAGTEAFDRKDYKHAVQLWETLAQVEPTDGPFVAQLRDGIAEARRLAGLPPAASSAPTAAAPPLVATLSGTVTLAPALAA